MKQYIIICLGLCLFLGQASLVQAVPKQIKARSEYMMADGLFKDKKYREAIEHALTARDLLGKSNGRIEYLLCKAYYELGLFGGASLANAAFFDVVPESQSGSETYNEMILLYSPIEEKRKEQLTTIYSFYPKMVSVKGGCFQTENTCHVKTDPNAIEIPMHEVCVDDFKIGSTEVTQGLYQAVMKSNPTEYQGENLPVSWINWYDAYEFIQHLNGLTGKSYRLPTGIEWQYAARSGGKNEKYAGGNDVDRVAWYAENSKVEGRFIVHQVAMKQANGLGLYDMSGNVGEFCHEPDCYAINPSFLKPNERPKVGLSMMLMGGGYISGEQSVTTGSSSSYMPSEFRYNGAGFRLADD